MKRLGTVLAIMAAAVVGLSGCRNSQSSGLGLQDNTDGRLGQTMKTEFFEFTVNSAYVSDSLDGYETGEGNQMLVADVTVRNTSKVTIPMSDLDFQLQWNDEAEDAYLYAITVDMETGEERPTIMDNQLPYEYELAVDEERTGLLIFEAPKDAKDFSISTEDSFDDGTTGEVYFVYFTPEQK